MTSTTAPATTTVKYIPALDGVRGIAILLVLLFHFTYWDDVATTIRLDRLVQKALLTGWVGVDLFFVLSGFLITGILLDTKGREDCLRTFYVRRLLRIFPVYYLSLLLFTIALPLLFPADPALASFKHDAFWYWSYLTNVRVALHGWPHFVGLGHFWSLAIEEQFYLAWPLVVLRLSTHRLRYVCFACVATALLIRVVLLAARLADAAYVLTPARIDGLAIGAALAVTAREPGGLQRVVRWLWPAGGLAAAGLSVVFVWHRGLTADDAVVATIGYTMLAVLFGSLVALAVVAPPGTLASRVLSSRGLTLFGRYSYGIYIFHHPLLLLNPTGLSAALFPTVLGSILPGRLVFIAIATAVSLAVAIVSWEAWESRWLSLKDRIGSRAVRRSPAVPGDGPEARPAVN